MITSVPAIRPAVDVLPVTIHVITNVSAVPVIRQVTAFARERARDVLICLTLDDQKFKTRNSSGKRIVATISE